MIPKIHLLAGNHFLRPRDRGARMDPHLQKYFKTFGRATRALKLDPNNIDALYQRAVARGSLGDMKGALVDLDRVIEINPSVWRAYMFKAACKNALGDKKGAEKEAALYYLAFTRYNREYPIETEAGRAIRRKIKEIKSDLPFDPKKGDIV